MHSVFDPASPQARAVAHLWWWMLGAGGTVWLVVVATMLFSIRRRSAVAATEVAPVESALDTSVQRRVTLATFITVLILLGFLVFDFAVGHGIANQPANPLTIELTGHQWWWEAQYADPDPSKRIVTANEMHVPVGEPVRFKLKSSDVIHSFWAPSLNGKRDLIPGYESTLWFQADTAGSYRGQCAEFCGLQHAKMAFVIVAEPKATFQAWLAAASSSPPPPTDSTLAYGERVFMSGGCAVCHTIGGTEARATVGPNLTHFKSRSTIAAGTLANTSENVARWVMNPQIIKPGTQMPPSTLSAVQLNALLAFLETMK